MAIDPGNITAQLTSILSVRNEIMDTTTVHEPQAIDDKTRSSSDTDSSLFAVEATVGKIPLPFQQENNAYEVNEGPSSITPQNLSNLTSITYQ